MQVCLVKSYAALPETRHLLLRKKQLYLLCDCYVARRPAHHDGLCKLVDAIERHVNVYLRLLVTECALRNKCMRNVWSKCLRKLQHRALLLHDVVQNLLQDVARNQELIGPCWLLRLRCDP